MLLRCASCGRTTAGCVVNAAVSNPETQPAAHSQIAEASNLHASRTLGADTPAVAVAAAVGEGAQGASEIPAAAVVPVAVIAQASTGGASDDRKRRELVAVQHYVTSRGWTAIEHLQQGPSTNDNRTARERILAHARSQQIKAVVCWKLDRFGCRAAELVQLLGDLTDLGVHVVAVEDGLDTATPDGKRLMRFAAQLVALEHSHQAAAGTTKTLPEVSRRPAQPVVDHNPDLPQGFAAQFFEYLGQFPETGRDRSASPVIRGRRARRGRGLHIGDRIDVPTGGSGSRGFKPKGSGGRGP